MADTGIVLPTQPPSPPQPKHGVFRGPNGIRAGWRALIFIVLALVVGLILVSPFIAMRMSHVGHHDDHQSFGLTPLDLGMSEGLIFLSAALAALVMSRIEHRKWGQYGLPWRSAFRTDFWVGIFVGFASISLTLLAIFAFHGFRITGVATNGSALIKATAAWCLTFVLVGLAEEFLFRGYLQYTLTTGIGFWPAAILLSVSFGAAHAGNPGESIFGLVAVVVFALVFSFILRRTGNLWWVVGFHAGWDWGQTFFYGVADSGIPAYHNFLSSSFNGPRWLTGGTVGPEASVFTPIVLVIVAIIASRVYRENLYRVENSNRSLSTPVPALQSPTTGL